MGICPSGQQLDSDTVSTEPTTSNQRHLVDMPLFKKQSEEAKKRQQHQYYLAKESPEPSYDLSGCELYDVPKGVFSLCKILQKESLFFHNNFLTSLVNKENSSVKDLVTLRVLDLHDNAIETLPNNLECLTKLQVLNLEGNKLKDLPDSIGKLTALQTLNVRRNRIKVLPSTICEMQSLRTLDLSENRITSLPQRFCYVKTLESILLDVNTMEYPSKDICSKGTREIMQYLCGQCGIEYITPSTFALALLDSTDGGKKNGNTSRAIDRDNLPTETTIQQYERIKEQKRLERVELERRLEEEQRAQTQLAAQSMAKQKDLLAFMAQDQNNMQKGLSHLQHQKDVDRQKMMASLYEIERDATEVIKQMLAMNENARKNEALLEAMERERIEAEQWFIVREEEQANLRKQEILVNMERILEENQIYEQLINGYLANQSEAARKAQESMANENNLIEGMLMDKQVSKSHILDQIIAEEKWQKEAFEALQLQKDSKHKRISNQIELIEYELSQLTLLEVERRQMRMDTEMNVLAEKRIALSDLLMQLIDERDKRVDELKNRLHEMEERRLDTQTDYWLVQFQRLLDKKPAALIDQENQLEFAVVDILTSAGAGDYMPLFARHRISIETMMQLCDEDLKQMGVHELGLRRAILSAVKDYYQQEKKAGEKTTEIESKNQESATPSELDVQAAVVASAPPPREVTARLNAECVVCMDKKSVVIFLNCGHVCCCDVCAVALTECPLCRQDIVQKITLAQTYQSFNTNCNPEDTVHMV